MNNPGFKNIQENLRETFRRFRERSRQMMVNPNTERDRSRKFTRNFFLHIHSSRIHPNSLQPATTWGLGLIALYLFLIEVATGILLMFYYTPSIERAYGSIQDIIYVVTGGGFIRNMHRWAAHGMVLVVILHMVRVFYTGSYLKGRAFNWIIGLTLLVVTLFLSFSGYLLPWDQLAFWAVTIGANIAGSASELTDLLGITGFIDPGGFIKRILLGGYSVGQDALIRFYLLHIIALPLMGAILIGVHFWRIRKDGGLTRPENESQLKSAKNEGHFSQSEENVSSPLESDSRDHLTSWPHALWAETAVLMLTLAVLCIVSYFFDAPLKEIANPATPENPAKSPWYFLALQELVSYSAFTGGIAIPLLLIIGLVSIPYLDREDRWSGIWFSGETGRRILYNSLVYATAITLIMIFITVQWGWVRDWIPAFPRILLLLFNPGTVLILGYALWSLSVLQQTGSTRMSAIALFTGVLAGFFILTVLGYWFRGPNWEFYWSPSRWPVY